MRSAIAAASRIVIKIGSSSVTADGRGLDYGAIDSWVRQIAALTPTVAMLDINLGDHMSFLVADRLLALDVPFMFATGYGEQAELPDQHKNRITMQKPYTLENVARAIPEVREQAAAG